ncbi:hypothetical protein QQX98_003249 [Neonectria punicea]|uniref:Major facilitator superfamily (MFS) profile domain-containing protein n=1 Tax=Neonectria punicea TaxID=979145 RepID=A0ABR1HFW7_9HYPO
MYPHLVIALLGNAPSSAIGSYGPTIINSMGYGALASNALTSVGSWIQLFLGPVFGVLADRTRRRAVVGVWHPINGSWIALNTRNAEERNVTMAIYIMMANCSGIVGGQLFRQADGPLYRTGWTVSVALLSTTVVAGIFANWQYSWLNRRQAKESEDNEIGEAVRNYSL